MYILCRSSETRMTAIRSNALTVLKIVAAFQEPDSGANGSMNMGARSSTSSPLLKARKHFNLTFNHMREITAQLLITLAYDKSIHDILAAEPVVNILILFLNQSIGFGFECALEVCLYEPSNTVPRVLHIFTVAYIHEYPYTYISDHSPLPLGCYLHCPYLNHSGVCVVRKFPHVSRVYGR